MSYFKIILLTICFFLCNIALAENVDPNPIDLKKIEESNAWVNRSLGIMENASKMDKPEWLQGKISEQDKISAEKLRVRADVVRKNLGKGMDATQATTSWVESGKNRKVVIAKSKKVENDENVKELPSSLIFISQSMPQSELKAAVEESSESGAVLVFRGIKPHQAVDHVGKIMYDIVLKNRELKPAVIINPELFSKYNIKSVPTTVVNFDGKTIKASGNLSIDYLLEQLENDKQGDLGVIGPTYDVVEPDMIEELKRRALLVDWEAQKKGLVDKFWTESWPNFSLPVATEDSAFLVDPTYVMKKDIVVQDKIVIKAGTEINPQKAVPLSQKYIFFDSTDERQKKVILKYIAKNNLNYESTFLIISEMDRKGGFKAYEELIKYFNGNRIFVMEKGMKERFKIKAVPSIVSGSGDFYKVQEIGINEK